MPLHFGAMSRCLLLNLKFHRYKCKAKRAAKSFPQDSNDREAMDARIAACEAGQDVSTKLDKLTQEKLAEKLYILENHLHLFPVQLAVAVTVRLLQQKIVPHLLYDKELSDAEWEAELGGYLSTLLFWEAPTDEAKLMDPENPSLYPIYQSMVERMSQTEDMQVDEDEAGFLDMMKKQRVLEKKDSEESATSQNRLVAQEESDKPRGTDEDLQARLLQFKSIVVE